MPRMLRLCATTDFAMLKRSFGVRIMQIEANMLPNMPWPIGQYTQLGHGEGRLKR